jgi:hypothetical protein
LAQLAASGRGCTRARALRLSALLSSNDYGSSVELSVKCYGKRRYGRVLCLSRCGVGYALSWVRTELKALAWSSTGAEVGGAHMVQSG